MLGILSGVMFAYADDLPQVSALDDYSPSTITRVYAAKGQLIGEFATQRRVVVGYDDINPMLRQAIIAPEDADFDRHFGINSGRIFAAAFVDIVERRREQGASTLTPCSRRRSTMSTNAAAKMRPLLMPKCLSKSASSGAMIAWRSIGLMSSYPTTTRRCVANSPISCPFAA